MTAAPAAPAQPLLAAWSALLQGLPQPAWVVALDTQRVVAANAAAALLLGRPVEALLGEQALALSASPEDMAYWAGTTARNCMALNSDALLARPDGGVLHVNRSIRPIQTPGGDSGHALVLLRDRSAEQLADEERGSALADLQATLEATADGILVTDLNGRIRSFNRRFAQLWAMPISMLQQHDDAAVYTWMNRSVLGPEDYERRLAALQQATGVTATDRLQLHSGQVIERVTRPLWSAGRVLGRVHSFRDLSERLATLGQIEAMSLTDALTGQANRRHLSECLDEAAGRVRREGGSFALLVVDLDRFRHVNESLGHEIGDQVLRDMGQRIHGCMRDSDMLARLGADQFALLVSPADGPAAEAMARRVLKLVAQPCQAAGATFTLTCSIGIALCPSHGTGIDDLTRHAEQAMRAVKLGGRASYRLHQARAEGDRRSHIKLDHAMRQALVSRRFRLHYQPQVALADGRLVGAEALLRWRDPELGDVPPARFIPVAEDSGFIVAIGDWVLSQAVRQAALWHQRGQSLPVAVNVSALQFQQPQFVDRVASVLAVSGMPAHLLELELTESILVHDADEALRRLSGLAALGVKLSIDDFGTGYSSLAYLKRFPIHKLKIDRSFVQGLPNDQCDAGIVRAILQMASALGMSVIAEGVETEGQRAFLQDAGCDSFQGFLFAPALDALSFEQCRAAGLAQAPPRIRLVSGWQRQPGSARGEGRTIAAALPTTLTRPDDLQIQE